jgi:hypothetical protein
MAASIERIAASIATITVSPKPGLTVIDVLDQ